MPLEAAARYHSPADLFVAALGVTFDKNRDETTHRKTPAERDESPGGSYGTTRLFVVASLPTNRLLILSRDRPFWGWKGRPHRGA